MKRFGVRWGNPVFTLVLFIGIDVCAQVYPRWFLEQETAACACGEKVVGFANTSFYPDSSFVLAFRNACEAFARNKLTTITGGQAFWSTEIGTFWMGADFQEYFDSTAIAHAQSVLTQLDVFVGSNIVAVVTGYPDCVLSKSLKTRIRIATSAPPSWVEAPPKDPSYYFAVGVAPEYFYETNSWLEAERFARRNLAREVFVHIKALQKMSSEGQEVRHEELSVTLRDIHVVARWRDVSKQIYYVLLRMPKD